MSQGNQDQSTPTLHPVLQNALRSLDINLEAELKRYRRYKAGDAPLPLHTQGSLLPQKGGHSSMTAGYKNGKSPDVIAVMAGSAALQNRWLSTASSDEAENKSQVKQENREQLGVREVEPQSGSASLVLTSYPGSAMPTKGGIGVAGSTPDKEVAIAQLETEPEEYLESSTELLKSLGTPPEGVAANSTSPEGEGKSKLLTPLGIGSMLLLLMTGGTLWFVERHPSVVGHLRDDNSKLVESNSTQATKTTYPKAVDLNLDSLSTLPTSPSSSPRPVSEPVAPKLPINNPVTPAASVEIPAVVPIPRIPGPDAVSGQYYYVVTLDGGVESLEEIGKIIPDARVQDFPEGRKIQLAVFPEESRALSLVRELADQGISAQIYKTSY